MYVSGDLVRLVHVGLLSLRKVDLCLVGRTGAEVEPLCPVWKIKLKFIPESGLLCIGDADGRERVCFAGVKLRLHTEQRGVKDHRGMSSSWLAKADHEQPRTESNMW